MMIFLVFYPIPPAKKEKGGYKPIIDNVQKIDNGRLRQNSKNVRECEQHVMGLSNLFSSTEMDGLWDIGKSTENYYTLKCYHDRTYINISEIIKYMRDHPQIFQIGCDFKHKKKGLFVPCIYWRILKDGKNPPIPDFAHKTKSEPGRLVKGLNQSPPGIDKNGYLPGFKETFGSVSQHLQNSIAKRLIKIYQECVPKQSIDRDWVMTCELGMDGNKVSRDVIISNCSIGFNPYQIDLLLQEWTAAARLEDQKGGGVLNTACLKVNLWIKKVMISFYYEYLQKNKNKRFFSVMNQSSSSSSLSNKISTIKQRSSKRIKITNNGHHQQQQQQENHKNKINIYK